MTPPTCARCGRPHDLDAAPDEGVCTTCGGPLVDAGETYDPERYQRLTVEALAAIRAAAPNRGRPVN